MNCSCRPPRRASESSSLRLIGLPWRTGSVALILLLLCGGPASAQGGSARFRALGEAVPDEIGEPLVSGDFDGDGRVDLVATGGLYLQRGPARFRAAPLPGFLGLVARSCVAGDFDGDGDLDLAGQGPAGWVRWNNDGAGNLTPSAFGPAALFAGLEVEQAVAGDVDLDGDLDLVLTGFVRTPHRLNYAPPILWLNNGTGQFTDASGQLPMGSMIGDRALCLLDTDLDGDLDLVAAGRSGSIATRTHWVNDGAGTFTVTIFPGGVTFGLSSLLVADFDGDGFDDFAVGRSSAPNAQGVEVHLTRPLGVFGSSFTAFPTAVEIVAAADLDADGRAEIVVSSPAQTATYAVLPSGALAAVPLEVLANPWRPSMGRSLAFDADGDGDRDLALAHPAATGLFLNPSTGRLFPLRRPLPARISVPRPMGDFDLDGDADLLCSQTGVAGGPSQLRVVLNDGTGLFQLGPAIGIAPTALGPQVLEPFDLEGDGDTDFLALAGSSLHPNAVLVNGGAGFTAIPLGSTPGVRSASAGDFDGDGDEDLLICRNPTGQFQSPLPLMVVENAGGGAVLPLRVIGPGSYFANQIAPADFDGDGDLDLFISAMASANSVPASGLVLLNQGGWTFTPLPGFSPGPSVGVVATDLDGDGAADAVFGSRVWRNVGGALVPTAILIGGDPGALVAADLDGDGDPDLVAAGVWFENLGGLVFGPPEPHRSGAGPLPPRAPVAGLPHDLVAPPIAGDWDADGDLDLLVYANRLLSNCGRQLAAGDLPRAGSIGSLDLYGAAFEPWVLAASAAPARQATPVGILQLLPSTFVWSTTGMLPASGGPQSFRAWIPPSLAGATVHWQAYLVNQARLTGRVTTTIVSL